MFSEEKKEYLEDKSIPLWQRILNLDASRFEKSRYAALNAGKFRLKDLNILRQLAPGMYATAAEEAAEFRETAKRNNGTWKKLGSIPAIDMNLHPELIYDTKAQDRYFSEHPELKTNV